MKICERCDHSVVRHIKIEEYLICPSFVSRFVFKERTACKHCGGGPDNPLTICDPYICHGSCGCTEEDRCIDRFHQDL